MADLISGRCSVELMSIFNYTASFNIFYVVRNQLPSDIPATSEYHHFVFLITSDKSETSYNYLAWSDALAPEDSEKLSLQTTFLSLKMDLCAPYRFMAICFEDVLMYIHKLLNYMLI
jgi:hypothetical protein